jgi:hypothetical protein
MKALLRLLTTTEVAEVASGLMKRPHRTNTWLSPRSYLVACKWVITIVVLART